MHYRSNEIDEAMFRHRLLFWYTAQKRILPWREDWKKHRNPYTVWLSEIMLQQTVIKAVIPVYHRFLAELPTVQDLARTDHETVRRLVRGLGYYRRFSLMKVAAEQLVAAQADPTQMVWPATRAAWMDLPGIGIYTSAAISSIAFDQPHAVVDGNVERVFCRLFDIRKPVNEPSLKKTYYEMADSLLCRERPGDYNQALMELGQTLCTPTTPRCEECPVQDFCLAQKNRSQHLAPAGKIKKATKEISMSLLIPVYKNQIVLTERPATAKFLKGTMGFLTLLQDEKFKDGSGQREIGIIRHNITNHRITARVLTVNLISPPRGAKLLTQTEVEPALIANLDRKAWHLFFNTALKTRTM